MMLEQVGVCAGAHQVQILIIDFVDQEPIGFQVTVAVVLPFSGQRMVFVTGRKRAAFRQQQDQLTQLRHLLAAPLSKLNVASELGATDQVSQAQIPKSLNNVRGDLKRFPLPRSAAAMAF